MIFFSSFKFRNIFVAHRLGNFCHKNFGIFNFKTPPFDLNCTKVINSSSNDPFNAEKSPKTPKRSRSLIRRSSKKAKQQIEKVHNPEDCIVS